MVNYHVYLPLLFVLILTQSAVFLLWTIVFIDKPVRYLFINCSFNFSLNHPTKYRDHHLLFK